MLELRYQKAWTKDEMSTHSRTFDSEEALTDYLDKMLQWAGQNINNRFLVTHIGKI